MKGNDLFDIIGDIDGKYIEEAKKKKKTMGKLIASIAGIAAVFCILILSPLGMNLLGRSQENKILPEKGYDSKDGSTVMNEYGLAADADENETNSGLYIEIIPDTKYPADTELDILLPGEDGNVTATRPVPEVPETAPLVTTYVQSADTQVSIDTSIDIGVVTSAEPPQYTVSVYVWYVSGGEVIKATVDAEHGSENVFAAWKDKNGIGDEVKLISVKVTDNSKTETKEFMGEMLMQHTAATEWYMTVTVSRELENYFEVSGKELLCESLEKTMVGFADKRNMASYQLVLG